MREKQEIFEAPRGDQLNSGRLHGEGNIRADLERIKRISSGIKERRNLNTTDILEE